jgi:hypothetical protein
MALVGIQDYIAGTAFQSTGTNIAAAVADARSILQVVSSVNRDVFTTTSTAFVPITGFAVTITPGSLSSQILLFGQLNFSAAGTSPIGFNLLCNGREIYPNNVVAGRYSGWALVNPATTGADNFHFTFLHRPTAVGVQTYTMQVKLNAAGTLFINRNSDDTANALTSFRGATSITAMEITT